MEQTSDASGYAQLYFDSGEGVREADSLRMPVRQGEHMDLFFPLPQRAAIKSFRLDPINVSGATVSVHQVRIIGPMGFSVAPEKLQLKMKPGPGIEFSPETKSGITTSSDPQIRFSLKPKPLTASRTPFLISNLIWFLLFTSIAAPSFWVLAMKTAWLERLLAFLSLAWVAFLVAHYVWPSLKIPSWIFYHLLLVPSVLCLALVLPQNWSRFKRLTKHPPFWALAAFCLYFGIHSFGLSGLSKPTRATVHAALFAIATLPLLLFLLSKYFPIKPRAFMMSWVALAILMTFSFVIWFISAPSPFEARLQQVNSPWPTPLFRALSGTACLVVPLLFLSHASQSRIEKKPVHLAMWVAAALPMMLYVLFSQSRSVILALIVGLVILAMGKQAIVSRTFAALFFGLALLFYFNLPSFLDRMTAPPEPVAAATISSPPPNEKETTEGGMDDRSVGGRMAIWTAYLKEVPNHWLFGHGFDGEQKLLIELSPELFAPEDAHLATSKWSPHSLHLSVLYFGGVTGLIIHGTLLGSIFFWGLYRWRTTGENRFLLGVAWIAFATTATLVESTLMAYDKDAVVLRLPNEYWIFYWGAVVFGIVQTVPKSQPADS